MSVCPLQAFTARRIFLTYSILEHPGFRPIVSNPEKGKICGPSHVSTHPKIRLHELLSKSVILSEAFFSGAESLP
jgi:hypothetical protein